MKALLFAEGSHQLGSGHQVRSGCLGAALATRAEVVLACRDHTGSAHSWAWRGLRHEVHPPGHDLNDLLSDLLSVHEPDLLVIDHRELPPGAVPLLASRTRLVVIDDLANQDWTGARLVVNTAAGASPSDYAYVPTALGLAHALVRSDFVAAAHRPVYDEWLLLLGGTDPRGLLPPLLRQLLVATKGIVNVVSGPSGGASGEEVRHLAATDSRVRWFQGLDAGRLAELMGRCRAGLLSASSVTLEAGCVGLPFVAVVTAPDQVRVVEGLRAAGISVLDPPHLEEAAARLEEVARVGPSPRWRVDGRGPDRLAARIVELTVETTGVDLRPVCWRDGRLLLEWAQDPVVRQASFSSRPVSEEEHWPWLRAKLMDPETRMWLTEREGRARGVLRLDRRGDCATVSITVAPLERGRGLGRLMLRALSAWNQKTGFAHRLLALVREDNPASRALFLGSGYRSIGTSIENGHPAQRFELQRG